MSLTKQSTLPIIHERRFSEHLSVQTKHAVLYSPARVILYSTYFTIFLQTLTYNRAALSRAIGVYMCFLDLSYGAIFKRTMSMEIYEKLKTLLNDLISAIYEISSAKKVNATIANNTKNNDSTNRIQDTSVEEINNDSNRDTSGHLSIKEIGDTFNFYFVQFCNVLDIPAFDSLEDCYDLTIYRYWKGTPSAYLWLWCHLVYAHETHTFANKPEWTQKMLIILLHLDTFIICGDCNAHYKEWKRYIAYDLQNGVPMKHILLKLHKSINAQNVNIDVLVEKLYLFPTISYFENSIRNQKSTNREFNDYDMLYDSLIQKTRPM
ncbi:p33 protein [Dolichomitus sp. PSUC_FEM 10030005]|nr:p33 protein [Dolichomitus sp. PSUC_FEM 10030005]